MADDDFGGAIADGAKTGLQIGAVISAVIAGLMMLLARPFVLVTQVLFRRDLGERYFDILQAMLSLVLIVAATAATVATSGPTSSVVPQYGAYGEVHYQTQINADSRTTPAYAIGIVWVVAFLAASAWHFRVAIPRRYRNGIMWHSRSDGVPRLPAITESLEVVILIALTVLAYWFKLEGFAVLLTFSVLTTIMSNAKKKAELYNRVLDAIDGQIESEWLGKAIEERLTPKNAHGLDATLPVYVSDAYRQKVAKMFKRPGPTITE